MVELPKLNEECLIELIIPYIMEYSQTIKVAPYNFMTARDLVTNLAENSLIIGKKYDVTSLKMNANILRFLRWIFLNVCTVQDKDPIPFHFSNSISLKISIEQIFLNVKKYHFLTLKTFCFMEFLENKELRVKLISSLVQI